jgi:hypothetical protein
MSILHPRSASRSVRFGSRQPRSNRPEQALPRIQGPRVAHKISSDESPRLVRRQGSHPIVSVEDLAAVDDPFESDEEYEEFLADLYASRRAGLV